MNRSAILLAGTVAVAAVTWIATGRFHAPETPRAEAAPAQQAATPMPDTAPLRVRVQTLHARSYPRTLTLLGRTEADRTVTVRAETAGRIAAVPLEHGNPVSEGALIARIATEDRPARLAEAEALVHQRRIEFEAAEDLAKKNFRSATKLAEAKALLQSAQAAHARIRTEMGHTTLRAPFAGILEDRAVEIGDFVSVGAPVATVVDLDPVVVAADVAEGDIGRLAPGALASVRLVDGRRLEGVLRFVATESKPATRTYRVEVEADNPDAMVRAGITAELMLSLGAVDGHRISPAWLTLADDGRIGVMTVDSGNRAGFAPVDIIADTPKGMWVSGLAPTVRVITVGQEFVIPGQPVTPVEQPAATAEVRS